jgi:dUTP pyrophosphatase
MEQEKTPMTEWLKLERLPSNDTTLPQYETEHSAAMDFRACLTRECRLVNEGQTFKETTTFRCGNNQRLFEWSQYNLEVEKTPPSLLLKPGETVMVPLGYKSEFRQSHVMMLFVRSSLGLRGIELANNTAIIDPDYRGEIWAVLHNRNRHAEVEIKHGERIVQAILLEVNQAIISEVDELGETERGVGGFGSTNKVKSDIQTQ